MKNIRLGVVALLAVGLLVASLTGVTTRAAENGKIKGPASTAAIKPPLYNGYKAGHWRKHIWLI